MPSTTPRPLSSTKAISPHEICPVQLWHPLTHLAANYGRKQDYWTVAADCIFQKLVRLCICISGMEH